MPLQLRHQLDLDADQGQRLRRHLDGIGGQDRQRRPRPDRPADGRGDARAAPRSSASAISSVDRPGNCARNAAWSRTRSRWAMATTCADSRPVPEPARAVPYPSLRRAEPTAGPVHPRAGPSARRALPVRSERAAPAIDAASCSAVPVGWLGLSVTSVASSAARSATASSAACGGVARSVFPRRPCQAPTAIADDDRDPARRRHPSRVR